MMYDITVPGKAFYVDYINLRNFEGSNLTDSGSLAPEGLCVVEAADSPSGYPLLLAANEVSGNVNVLEIADYAGAGEIVNDSSSPSSTAALSDIPKTGVSFTGILFIMTGSIHHRSKISYNK